MTSPLSRDGEGPGVTAGASAIHGRGGSPELGEDVCERLRVTAFAQGGARIVEIALPGSYLGKVLGLLDCEWLTARQPRLVEAIEPPLFDGHSLWKRIKGWIPKRHRDPWRKT